MSESIPSVRSVALKILTEKSPQDLETLRLDLLVTDVEDRLKELGCRIYFNSGQSGAIQFAEFVWDLILDRIITPISFGSSSSSAIEFVTG